MWTSFWDMHSGGGTKEPPYENIYIEAPEEEAKVIFYNRFGHNPERVTCTCCGDDYSIRQDESLENDTAYHRNCAYVYTFDDTGERASSARFGKDLTWDPKAKKHHKDGRLVTGGYVEEPDLGLMEYGRSKEDCQDRYQTLEQYIDREDVLVIYEDEIMDFEREGSVPEQGYVWVD